MLTRLCSKSFKLSFSSTWTENFQIYKQDLEKVEEPEVKLPTSIGSLKKQESSRKTSALLTTPKPLTVWITTNWKIIQGMGTPDHFTCLLRNLYADQEATVSKNWTWNNGLVPNRKRSTSGCILSPCLFNFYAEYIMWNAGLDELQAGIKVTERNINNLRYADDTTLMAESDEGERRVWKSWLETQVSKN